MPMYINPPPQNPLTRIIATIIAVFALAGAFMIGMVALLVVAAVALVAGLAIWLRIVWIKRRLRKSGVELNVGVAESRQSGQVIDAEYTVVSNQKDHRDD